MLWDSQSGSALHTFEGHAAPVQAVAISHDGRYAVSASLDGIIRVWDLNLRQEMTIFEGHDGAVTAVAMSPDGKSIVSGSTDNTVRVWDFKSGTEIRRLNPGSAVAYDTAISADARYALFALSDHFLESRNIDQDREECDLEGYTAHFT